MSMIQHLTSEVLFDPIYEFHDMYKLSCDIRYLYGVKQGIVMRSDLEVGSVNAALTAWLVLHDLIREIEGDDNSTETVW